MSRLDTVVEPAAEEIGALLLETAAAVIGAALETGRAGVPDHRSFRAEVRAPGASFVTLERDGALLGCIGTIEPARPLIADVAHNALAAAFADPRLPSITGDDYENMSIKVSVLSRREPVGAAGYDDLVAMLRPGVDGVVVETGRHRSTLLPSVWQKVSGAHEFVEIVWRKAGLVPGRWPAGTCASRYTATEFHDPGPRSGAPRRPPVPPRPNRR